MAELGDIIIIIVVFRVFLESLEHGGMARRRTISEEIVKDVLE